MKRFLKIIIPIILIFTLILNMLPTYVKADEVIEKGTLRCPPDYLNNGCIEIKDANGQVVEAQVTKTVGNATITKFVKKTNNPGELKIQFKVDGKSQMVTGDAYIVVILDASSTMYWRYNDLAVPAAKNFANAFDPANNPNIKLAFFSFYSGILAQRGFENNNFDNVDFKDNCNRNKKTGKCKSAAISGSDVANALNNAQILFENTAIPENAKKFIVVLGDGVYSWNKISKSPGYLYTIDSANDVTVYSIGWGDASDKKYEKNMIDIAGSSDRYVYAGANDVTSYQNAFNAIFEKIHPIVENTKVSIKIDDYIGEYFNVISSSNLKTQSFISDNTPYVTEEITIQVDDSAPNGWHNTNNGFEFNDNLFNINPEIYWEQQTENWTHCSDSIETSKLVANKTGYYTISCKQEQYKADLMIDNQPIYTNKFHILNGRGFPISVNLSSYVNCTYDFNTQLFVSDYNNIMNNYNQKMNEYNRLPEGIAKTNALKDAASLEKKKIDMETILNNYITNSSNITRLSEYKDTFNNQQARLYIKYYDNVVEQLDLINSANTSGEVICSEERIENILGNSVNTYKFCSLNSAKTMELPSSCLSMRSGEKEICSTDSNNQLSGGNKFYVIYNKIGGYVSLELPSATLFGSTIKLEGEKRNTDNPNCEFTIGNNSNVIFRQIELADPFIQSRTNKTRTIGRNWSSNNYYFVNTIKSNIWENTDTYEYQYDMSKMDVENIRKNTSEIGVNSYLGRSCGFNKDNKYVCEFVRPDTSGNSSFFTNIRVK